MPMQLRQPLVAWIAIAVEADELSAGLRDCCLNRIGLVELR
jgi:hypothetical protein